MPGKGGTGRKHLALASLAAFLLFVVFTASAGLGLGIGLAIIMLFPVLIWLMVGGRRKGIAKRIAKRVRKDLSMGHAPRYLKGEPSDPKIGRRTLSVIVAVFGLTAVILRMVKFVLNPLFPGYFANFTTEWLAFVFLSLLVLTCLPFVMIPAWVKNDAGLRIYDREKLLVTAPGSTTVRVITGVGLLTSLVYLFNTINDLSFLVFIELLFVGPSCYLAVAAFGVLQERRLKTYIINDPELNSELSLRIDFTGTQPAGVGTQPVSIIHLQQGAELLEAEGE